MPEFKEFTLEGEASLDYFAGESFGRDRHVRIKTDSDSDVDSGERIEHVIAQALDFPNDEEFDVMFRRNEQLREQGLQTEEGQPDIVRTGVRLRVSVEIVE